ncbi:hypothetical protein ASF11_18435 [Acidovorax sp. Leaf76]|nr:hypothetical protein ASF11_18435 [Acidovorax sp. Leaf76]
MALGRLPSPTVQVEFAETWAHRPIAVRVELVETWALLAGSLMGSMPLLRAEAGSRPACE